MKLSIDVNAADASAVLKAVVKQAQFAAVVALTRAAQEVRTQTPGYLDRVLDRPTPFTKRGVYVQRATLSNPVAEVGVMDRQAAYLRYQEQGGDRPPARRVIVLPSDIRRDQYGSIPRLQLRRLYDAAKANRRATAAIRRRLGVSRKVDLFVGEPGNGFPPGIYKRVPAGLVPLVVFRDQPVRYRPRMAWVQWASRLAQDGISGHFETAIAGALGSAR